MSNYFEAIASIKLTAADFKNIKLNKNNQYYGFVLNICQILYENLLLNEEDGRVLFKDFERDDKAMAYLFENFVRNFYKREYPEFRVWSENIHWDTEDADINFLLIMKTDISIEKKG